MKTMIPDLRSQLFRNGMLLMMFAGFAMNLQGQTPPPVGGTSLYFCSATSWANGGFPLMPGDNLGDLDIEGQNLQWYAAAGPSNPIPPTTLMADGTTYYVTQTIGGVESAPLAVTVIDRGCACIKEPDFEDQSNNTDLEGYIFLSQPESIGHKICDLDPTPGTVTSITPGPLNTYTQSPADFAVPVSPGPDPNGDIAGSNLVRTNPADPTSQRGIRVGGTISPSIVVFMTKEFVAGEVLSFSFSAVLDNPAGHPRTNKPFFQAKIYDANDNLIASRCLVSNPTDCIFKNPLGGTLFTEWSCLKFNTLEIQGQYARLEVGVVGCSQSAHYGYYYMDDIFVGDDADSPCNNISFGYVAVENINPAQGTGSCYVTQSSGPQGLCSSGATGSLPFPIEVCGSYSAPISTGAPATLNSLKLDILQNNTVVGTLTMPTLNTGAQTFCFIINDTDINVSPPYGKFDFEATIDYTLDCGSAYGLLIDDRGSVQICPPAGCPLPLVVCDDTGTGIGIFDLTAAEPAIRNGFAVTDVGISFYETKADAFAQTGAIATPASYNNTLPNNQIIYARLDWNLTAQGCTYLVELDLQVRDTPIFTLPDRIVACDQNFDISLIGTPDNLSDLNSVSYAWYKDGVRIPFFGSLYHATAPGTYEVTVSNDIACTKTETIVIDQVLFSVDLGPDVQECDVLDYTLTANIIDEGSTPPIDPTQATYLWSTNETTQSIAVSTSGTYTVDVTIDGCTHSASVNVEISDRPEVTLGADFEICASEETQITATVANLQGATLEYKWYRDGGLIAGQNASILPINDAGTYRVEVNAAGAGYCIGEDSIEITIYANENCVITQGISPNGDNFNQSLDLLFLDDRTGVASVEIFNRYGRLVYEKTGGYTNQWEGQSDEGDELVTGTYFYVIKLDAVDEIFDKQVLTGWIYIQRQVN